MDETAFTAALERDGFQEVLRRRLEPGSGLPEHQHAWAVRGLVIEGRFRVAGARLQDCGPGDVFALEADEPHEEGAGPEGALLLIGRRHPG